MSEEISIRLPKLGESILSATIIQWFKKEGDFIQKDEALVEVATDKINSEIPSPFSGVIKKILFEKDQEVNVGETIALLQAQEMVSSSEEKTSKSSFFSPAILQLAKEKNLSLEALQKIPPTGSGGRLSKKDVKAFCQQKEEKTPFLGKRVPLTPMRRAIAENLSRSVKEIPHASLIADIDMSDIVMFLAQEKEKKLKQKGIKLTLTSFISFAIAKAAKEFPFVNSFFDKEAILLYPSVNLGIATHVEGGILVPVLKNCETLSLWEIAQAIEKNTKKARSQELALEECNEGTITLTNFGMTGISLGFPIIRFPEVAIIGAGALQKRVVVGDNDSFIIRSILSLSLTFDHRVIDGVYGSNFLNHVKKLLEEFPLNTLC